MAEHCLGNLKAMHQRLNGKARDRQHKPVEEGKREGNSLAPPKVAHGEGTTRGRRGHPWRGKEGKPEEEKGKERQLVAESQRRKEEEKVTTNPRERSAIQWLSSDLIYGPSGLEALGEAAMSTKADWNRDALTAST